MRVRNKKDEPGHREKAIGYKKVFGGEEGRTVLFDLINKFHVLNTHKGDAFMEGQRSVVLWVMSQAYMDLEYLDKLLKGEIG